MSSSKSPLSALKLGQQTSYPSHYDPLQLQAIPRTMNRDPLGIDAAQLPFDGLDRWLAYEVSWLNLNGLPQVAIAEFSVPCHSQNLIESKSFKLYLNSFNEHRFANWSAVEDCLRQDLSASAGAPVTVTLHRLDAPALQSFQQWSGTLLDELPIVIDHYDYKPKLLAANPHQQVSETFISHLLKSNCLITNQPDWGSIMIRYQGPAIDPESLLRYLVSFRRHNEFHEQCVERIFADIQAQTGARQLTVMANYTRRGGLDINPFRSNYESAPPLQRLVRQ